MEKERRHDDAKLQRLLLLSQKEQWNIDDLNWEGLHFEEMPIPFQRHLATVFSHLHYGEQMALQCVQRLRNEIAEPIQRELLEIQIQDEKRHVVFSKLLQSLHPSFPLRDSLKTHKKSQCSHNEKLLVGIHNMIENIAHCLFQCPRYHYKCKDVSNLIVSLQEITDHWIPNYLMIDESRHLAIGHIMLSGYVSCLLPNQKIQVEGMITRWKLFCWIWFTIQICYKVLVCINPNMPHNVSKM